MVLGAGMLFCRKYIIIKRKEYRVQSEIYLQAAAGWIGAKPEIWITKTPPGGAVGSAKLVVSNEVVCF